MNDRIARARGLTLEALKDDLSYTRRKIKSWFSEAETLDDIAEQQLKAQISHSDYNEPNFLSPLLKDYSRFKNAPGFSVGNGIFGSWIFEEERIDNGGVQSNGFTHKMK